MKKLAIVSLLLSIAAPAMADCLVELQGSNTQPFIKAQCREAMKQCSKYRRQSNQMGSRCTIVDRNYNPYPTPNPQGPSRTIIQDFINGHSRNCNIQPYVNGMYHQVYINGQFRGNYDVTNRHGERNLSRVLNNYVRNGSCDYNRNGQQHDPSRYIIQDYVSDVYVNCYVEPNVGGYHQVYVNGQFKGNYDISNYSEKYNLKRVLTNYDRQGTCYKY